MAARTARSTTACFIAATLFQRQLGSGAAADTHFEITPESSQRFGLVGCQLASTKQVTLRGQPLAKLLVLVVHSNTDFAVPKLFAKSNESIEAFVPASVLAALALLGRAVGDRRGGGNRGGGNRGGGGYNNRRW